MCGIAGMLDRSIASHAALSRVGNVMAEALAHRGPDGSGVWCDSDAGIVLAHRRLAVIDIGPTGAQPMHSHDGRWVISYNGEIYNARTIATAPELADVAFRGTSDTEVIVESVARRGLDRTLAEMNGMFAMALWDRKTRSLHLIRDRLGIKPLFYTTAAGTFYFSSELKALHAAGAPLGSIDPASVASFLRFGYVPAPHGIYRSVAKVMPGEVVSVSETGCVTRRSYWSVAAATSAAAADPLELSETDATARLHDLLARAVSDHMISDVPIGAFLSGGIDSSLVAALMVAAGRGPVRTFSIGFPDFGFDESAHAAAVARHLGTEHEQMVVGAADALDVIPQIPEIYDEPFADSSQIPTYLVSKLTRRHVTVALSGDGGDELFGGYNRYRLAESLAATVLRVPTALRRSAAKFIKAVPDHALDRFGRLIPSSVRPPQLADKLKKAADILPSDSRGIYLRLVSQCPDPSIYAQQAAEHPIAWERAWGSVSPHDLRRHMQGIDLQTYLPDDILQKVDRASMAVALEVRPPLLDHRVVEFALRLPRRFQIRRGETKWLLRAVLDRYVPRRLIDRPKMGFGVPLAAWLRGPLRGWTDDLLDRNRFGGGLLDADAARALWADHVGGGRNNAYALWTLLTFEAWRRRWSGVSADAKLLCPAQ